MTKRVRVVRVTRSETVADPGAIDWDKIDYDNFDVASLENVSPEVEQKFWEGHVRHHKRKVNHLSRRMGLEPPHPDAGFPGE